MSLQGDLYIGGRFTQAGGINATNVARWDGTKWHALGSGLDGPVRGLLVDEASVFAAGDFLNSGTARVRHVARWDGTNWVTLADGLDGSAWALASSGTDLYVGGNFGSAGGIAASNVARWDGSNWTALADGVGGPVTVLAISGGQLYAGGTFTNAGSIAALNIALWNGSHWSGLAGGVGKTVYAIAPAVDGTVFVGGDSSDAGVVSGANNVAKWNGSAWKVLGSGVNGTVRSLLVRGSEVYAGGSFTSAGGIGVMGFARWDDGVQAWASFGQTTNNGIAGNILSLVFGPDAIYAGGLFVPPGGGVSAQNLARFSFSRWEALGGGLLSSSPGGSLLAVATSANQVYVGGDLAEAGGVPVANVARWDGSVWSNLGAGVNGNVMALALDALGRVYAGGAFTVAGGLQAFHVARWDGLAWSPLGLGLDGDVAAMAIQPNSLYVGGQFGRAGGFSANNIARWDGSNWSRLGSGVNGKVAAIAVSPEGLVYAGGDFTNAGGLSANRIASWDGTLWHPLGSGLNNTVSAITVLGTNLYVGGDFTTAGGNPGIQYFARWDGSQWWALGAGLGGTNPVVNAIVAHPSGTVFVAGQFTLAGGLPANRIAAWDGLHWSVLGSGVDDAISAIALRGRDLFVGGQFTKAGTLPSLNFGHWSSLNQLPSVELTSPLVGQSYLAPASITLAASANDPDGTVAQVSFYSKTNLLQTLPQPPYAFVWTNVAPGTYFLSAQALDSDGGASTSSTVVVVVNTNQPPQVSVLSPTNQTALFAPADLVFQVDAFDTDGRILGVDFLVGTNLVGTATTEPFQVLLTNVLAGIYTLTARATDDFGASQLSAPVTLIVQDPAPLQLLSAQLLSDGSFQIQFSAQASGAIYVQTSTNLLDWVTISTNSTGTGTGGFIDLQAPNFGQRFYRASYAPW